MAKETYMARSAREAESFATKLRQEGKTAYAKKRLMGGYQVVVQRQQLKKKAKRTMKQKLSRHGSSPYERWFQKKHGKRRKRQ
jgi:hypothetical protein